MTSLKEVLKLTTFESVRAFSDPYRLRIISTIRDFKRPATVKEISDAMGETPAKVHYHVKKLEKAGILSLVATKEINGIIAKYYEPTAERFVIKYDPHDEELAKVYLGEMQRMICGLYERSRAIVLKQLEYEQLQPSFQFEQDRVDFVRSHDIYLTKEEALEFAKLIQQFAKKRSIGEQKERQRYHFFAVLRPFYEDITDD